jgi:transcription antitermination factor NusG
MAKPNKPAIIIDKSYKWNILFVKTNHELKVQKYIERFGVKTYLPVRKLLSQWSDRKKWIDRPMFPGYVFIRVSCQEFFTVLSHNSIISYVKSGGNPVFISEEQISIMQKIESEYLEHISECDCFTCGDHIRIIAGPLKGLEGRILRIDSNDYFVIDLPEINKSLKIRIKKEMIVTI